MAVYRDHECMQEYLKGEKMFLYRVSPRVVEKEFFRIVS